MSEFDWKQCKTNRRGDKVLWAHEIRINYLIYGFLVESSGLLDYMTVEKHTGLCNGNGDDGYDLVMPNRVEWWHRWKDKSGVMRICDYEPIQSARASLYRVELDDEDNVIKIERVREGTET